MCRSISVILLLLYLAASPTTAQQTIQYFKLQDVKLLDSPFRQAEELNKKYLLSLDADRLLAPFLREAGLPQKAESYTNWENTGLDGHIGGHYLSALSLMYASTGDAAIKARLEYMIAELEGCQQANGNGYIGGVPGGKQIWEEIEAGNIKAGAFSLNDKWVPLYNIHKTYAGLRDAYLIAGNERAKEMLIRMSDWAIQLVSKLSEAQIQDMLRSEHGGLNETFADVAAITGDEKYLRLAHQFSHQFVLNPLIKQEDQLTGMHANTQIPKVLGFKRIAEINGDKSWEEAARFFWETVVQDRSVCIGGNSVSEHFHPKNDFSGMIKSIEGPETCNTYNMLRLSKMLFQTSEQKKYIDYYERALYNHILSTQHPETGGLVYFTQMRPGHYRVYSQPHTSMWCCVGSGMENHSKYREMIYAHSGSKLFVNLFIPSSVYWKEQEVELIQETRFPEEDASRLTVIPKNKNAHFTLQVRKPDWLAEGKWSIQLNGKELPAESKNGYIAISRKWKKGDRVIVRMPMEVRAEQLPDQSGYYAFLYGPIVLAAPTGTEHMDGLFADDSRGGHIAKGKQTPLKDMPIVVGEASDLPSLLQAIPEKPLSFRIRSLYPEKYSNGLELIPFFRLHDSRYIIYWPQATEEGVVALQAEIERQEKDRIALDAISVDRLSCGQQQPESDHFIESEDSRIGSFEDIHWREAKAWFSYRLKSKNVRFLYISYLDKDKSRNFNVLVNGQVTGTLSLTGQAGDKQQTRLLPLPEKVWEEESLTVRFEAQQGSMTGKIVEVRVLSEKPNNQTH